MLSSHNIAEGRSRAARRRLVFGGLAYLLVVALIWWIGARWTDARVTAEAAARARASAAARASLFTSELQKYRLIPVVLGEYPDVRAVLAAGASTGGDRLDDKLEQLAGLIGSSAIYLIDERGRTIAASNARLPTSFVGRNYGFRPYFTVARDRGMAEFFGLGTVSGRPGLYLARRVGTPPHAGVIVVKFGFDAVEQGWGGATPPAYVVDDSGVVLITNRPAWRFRGTRPLAPARLAEVRRTRQFGLAPLAPLPVKAAGGDRVLIRRAGGGADTYAAASLAVPVAGWRLTALEPVAPIRAAAAATSRLVTAAAALLLMIPLFAWLRARERADLAAIGRIDLEEKVVQRTRELEASQTRFREAREALAHANRLGSIGQITAAVAHEINQPVAAIRSFAANGAELLRRGDAGAAATNLATISTLTARIGAITSELRSYARRGSGEVRATSVAAAIDGALLFVGHRLRGQGVTLRREGDTAARVCADPLRFEQILVNLLHNALDAQVPGAPLPILLRVGAGPGVIELLLLDGGRGVPAAMIDRLFTPFATSRSDGLGLGLGIARDIAREFGGELELVPPPPPWSTAFRLRLLPA